MPDGSLVDRSDRAAESAPRIAVFCVGNKLMLDDGLGTAVFEELTENYEFPANVEVLDVGCMSLDMVGYVDSCDYLVTVDAVDGTGEEPGTVFEFEPSDMAVKRGATASLHELTLADLFEAATLMGYEAQGKCFGMQISNMSPAYATIGLTPEVDGALPLLIDAVLADLHGQGVRVISKKTGETIEPGWHHVCS